MFVLRKFIGNESMGSKVAWSDRMISFYMSIWFFALVWRAFRRTGRPLPWWGFLILMLPIVLDGGTHAISDLAGIGQGFRAMIGMADARYERCFLEDILCRRCAGLIQLMDAPDHRGVSRVGHRLVCIPSSGGGWCLKLKQRSGCCWRTTIRHERGWYPRAAGGGGELEVIAEAGDGEEAQALIQKHKPDVAVLDIQMPKASGIEVTRWVRCAYAGSGGPDIDRLRR